MEDMEKHLCECILNAQLCRTRNMFLAYIDTEFAFTLYLMLERYAYVLAALKQS